MKKFFLLALTGAVLITGCKKATNTDCAETVAGIAGSYKISKLTVNGTEIPLSSADPCEVNALFTLNADGTGSYTETGTGCDPTPDTGTWTVVNSILTADFGEIGEGTVVNNCSSITISNSEAGISYTATLAKQ